jgi:hypothetical protein
LGSNHDQRHRDRLETGDAIELIELGKALQFNPAAALRRIAKIEE